MIAGARRRGAETQRIGAGSRLGHSECLQAKLAAGDAGQIARLLLRAAVAQQRAHRVHLRVAGGAVAARRLDLFHDRRGGIHGQAAAAIFLGDERGEKSGLGQRRDEFLRVSALAVERAPIFAGKIRAERTHGLADRREVRGFHRHLTSARPLVMATTSRSTTRARKLTTAPSRHIWVRIVSPGNTGAEKRHPNEISRLGS